MSLSPFLKLDDPNGDFLRLCRELRQPDLLTGPDISEQDHPRRYSVQPSRLGSRLASRVRTMRRRARR